MAYKGSYIKMIVLQFFILAIVTVINGRPAGSEENKNITPPVTVVIPPTFAVPGGELGCYVEVTTELDEEAEANLNFTKHTLVINGVDHPKGVFGNTDIYIRWLRIDELLVNNKAIPVANRNKEITVKFHEDGGITVNDQKHIEGFEEIKGTGRTVLKLKNCPEDETDDESGDEYGEYCLCCTVFHVCCLCCD